MEPLTSKELVLADPAFADLMDPANTVLTIAAGLEVSERGVYAAAAARINRTLARSMAIHSDVILFLVHGQPPLAPHFVVDRLVHLASAYSFLVDNRFAIVAAQYDRDQQNEIRRLGRDRNMQIACIPQENGHLPSQRQLQRLLAADLYSIDPFNAPRPVSEDHDFYGRRDEVLVMARELQQGAVKSLFAVMRAGKTSVIDRLQRIGTGQGSFVSAVLDCQRQEFSTMSSSELRSVIVGSLHSAATSDTGYWPATPDLAHCSVQEKDLWAALRERGKSAVLMVDEVDYITPWRESSDEAAREEFLNLWSFLRWLVQESAREGVTVGLLVAGVSSHYFQLARLGGRENAAWRLVPVGHLPPFDRPASIAMIQALGNRCGLLFGTDAANALADMCGDYPHAMRQAGSYLHGQIDVHTRPRPIDRVTAEEMTERYIDTTGRIEYMRILGDWIQRMPVAAAELRSVAQGRYRMDGLLQGYGLVASTSKAPSRLLTTAVHGLSDQNLIVD